MKKSDTLANRVIGVLNDAADAERTYVEKTPEIAFSIGTASMIYLTRAFPSIPLAILDLAAAVRESNNPYVNVKANR